MIGSNIVSIGKNTFAGCSKVTSISIGKNVTEIGKNAFANCKNLEIIIIKSKKLTSQNIAEGAFRNISNDTAIEVPKSKYKAYKKLFRAKSLKKDVEIRKN